MEVMRVSEIMVDATVENMDKVVSFVEEQLDAIDCPMKAKTQINIAIDELFSNISFYAYNPEVGTATVRVDVENNPPAVVVTFIDQGKEYNPLEKDEPDITASAEDRPIGGLGVFMVKKMMDAIEYEYKNGQNILKIKKNIGK
jgi:anti-sigma regulatory factor (Ser/Thr protein kinase)